MTTWAESSGALRWPRVICRAHGVSQHVSSPAVRQHIPRRPRRLPNRHHRPIIITKNPTSMIITNCPRMVCGPLSNRFVTLASDGCVGLASLRARTLALVQLGLDRALYEPFGWAVYHYGYWHYDPIWGWLWLPGDKWFSARVKWMVDDDYVCWAPTPPPGYYIGDPWHTDVNFIWNAVHAQHFTHSSIQNFTVRPPRPMKPIPKDDHRYRKEPKLKFVDSYTQNRINRCGSK